RDELEHLARGARFRRQLHLLDDRANLGLGRIGLAASSDDRSKRYETQQQVQACPAEGVAGTRTLGVAHARTIACGPSQRCRSPQSTIVLRCGNWTCCRRNLRLTLFKTRAQIAPKITATAPSPNTSGQPPCRAAKNAGVPKMKSPNA